MSIWPSKDTKWAKLTHTGPGLPCWCRAQQGAYGNICFGGVSNGGDKDRGKGDDKDSNEDKSEARMMAHGNMCFRGVSNGGDKDRGKGDDLFANCDGHAPGQSRCTSVCMSQSSCAGQSSRVQLEQRSL